MELGSQSRQPILQLGAVLTPASPNGTISCRWRLGGKTCICRFDIRGRVCGVDKDGGLHFSTGARTVAIGDLHLRLERFTYEYDFDDYWNHDLRIDATLPLSSRRQDKRPD